MANQRSGCLLGVLIVLLVASVFGNFILLAALGSKSAGASIMATARGQAPRFDEEIVVPGNNDQRVALISLRGIITAAESGAVAETALDDLKLQLQQAVQDSRVKAIVLAIDSPGGEVTASDVLYEAVRKARDRKPVVVHMGSLAASGGYYVACGGSWLMASETTITGSIGVIIQSLNYQQLLGKIGLETITFKSGKFKDMLSGSRPMTQEEMDYVQALIMQTYERFVGIVAKERELPLEQLKTGIADGRVISGKDALEFKLINQLGHIEDAYEKARELGNASGAAVVRYASKFQLSRFFRLLGQKQEAATKVEVKLAEGLLPRLEAGRLYYLPAIYGY